jgi:hypothetical protein
MRMAAAWLLQGCVDIRQTVLAAPLPYKEGRVVDKASAQISKVSAVLTKGL